MFDEAIAEMQTAVKLSGGSRVYYLGQLANVYAASGNRDAALRIRDELMELSQPEVRLA